MDAGVDGVDVVDTSPARPLRTSCMAVWPEKPASGSERYQA